MISWLAIALPFVKDQEGCVLIASPDPVSGGEPWTIGYGATGPNISAGLVWTQEQADSDLSARLTVIGNTILGHSKCALNDNQLAALCDFAYNEGLHALLVESTLWILLQAGRSFAIVAQHFLEWDIACGRVIQGLENRRVKEQYLFLSPCQS